MKDRKPAPPKRVMPWVDVRTSDVENDEYESDQSLPFITDEEAAEYQRKEAAEYQRRLAINRHLAI